MGSPSTYLTTYAYHDLLNWWREASEALGRRKEQLWYHDLLLKVAEFEHSLLSHPEDGRRQLRDTVLKLAEKLYSLRHDEEQLCRFMEQQVELNRDDFGYSGVETILQAATAIAEITINEVVEFSYDKIRDQAVQLITAVTKILDLLDPLLQPVLFHKVTDADLQSWLEGKTELWRDGKVLNRETLKQELQEQFNISVDNIDLPAKSEAVDTTNDVSNGSDDTIADPSKHNQDPGPNNVCDQSTEEVSDELLEQSKGENQWISTWRDAVNDWYLRHCNRVSERFIYTAAVLRYLQEQHPDLARGVTEEMISNFLTDELGLSAAEDDSAED